MLRKGVKKSSNSIAPQGDQILNMNYYELSKAVRNGLIDKDSTLTFDLDQYYQSILSVRSERDLERELAAKAYRARAEHRRQKNCMPWE